MFGVLKDPIYFGKTNLLFMKGVVDGSIVSFEEDFYKKMSDTYIYPIPVSLDIKYLGRLRSVYDRSFSMFMCFDNAVLVRASRKDLELANGKENAGHAWIEIDNYVYDPTSLLRFEKELYYKMYAPTDIYKWSKDDYVSENIISYEEIKNTTLEDFKPGGEKRASLVNMMPLFDSVGSLDFREEFNSYLNSIDYEEDLVLKRAI